MATTYAGVIAHYIKKAQKLSQGRDGIAGFCSLQGPTGGGKSSALYKSLHEDEPAVLEVLKDHGVKGLFVTHRWNILQDVYRNLVEHQDSQGRQFTASVLYSQQEAVTCAVTQIPLPHEKAVTKDAFPNPFKEIDSLVEHKILNDSEQDRLSKNCRELIKSKRELDFQKNRETYSEKYKQQLTDEQVALCRAIEGILYDAEKNLKKELEDLTKKFGAEHKVTRKQKKKWDFYRNNPWVRRIFPAIVWRDKQQHLLILTTHKFYNSFYDGEEKVRLSSSKLKGYAVFIDEFDYQSDELLKLLAQAQHIQEPAEFLGQFLGGGKRLINRIGLGSNDVVESISQELIKLLNALEEDLATRGVDLNVSRSFVMSDGAYERNQKFRPLYLFRSDHFITNKSVSVAQTERGFVIQQYEQGKSLENIKAGDLLRVMEKYTRQLSLLFAEHATNEVDAQHLLRSVCHLMFNSVNDYQPAYYSQAISNMSLHALPRTSLVEAQGIIKSNVLANTHTNLLGLSAWLLKQDSNYKDIDPLRIMIKRAYLPTTAEGLLAVLASRNLVFALSATSYIERAIGHFDLLWVTQFLTYIAESRTPELTHSFLGDEFQDRSEQWFKKPIPYIPNEEDLALQQQVIVSLAEKKKEKRQTKLELHRHQFDQLVDTEELKEVERHLSPEFFSQPGDDFSTATEWRRDTLKKLIWTLKEAASKAEHRGHLVFVNSLACFKKWLLEDDAKTSRDSLGWLTLQSEYKETAPFIELKIGGRYLTLCLLEAAAQKQESFEQRYQQAFATGKPVIILTQRASATNGINLDYQLEDGRSMDLTCLYIIESHHFFFSTWNSQNNDSEMTHVGVQLRNLDKLTRQAQLSHQKRRIYIQALMSNEFRGIRELNAAYKKSEDYVKNIAADVQQQVGRLERSWELVPEIEIHMCQEVAHELEKFTHLPTYTNNIGLMSDLNQQLFSQLKEKSIDFESYMVASTAERYEGSKAEEIIDNRLVASFAKIRKGETVIGNPMRVWHELGEAVLKMDFCWQPQTEVFGISRPLKDWACFKKSKLLQNADTIYYDPNTWQFYPKKLLGSVAYQPQQLYQAVQSNSAIYDWFNYFNYRTSIWPFAHEFEQEYALHPKVVQRILQGRIGEESIRGLLYQDGIVTATTGQEAELFELYDFKVKNSSVYIDAKNWSSSSLDKADDDYQLWVSLNDNNTPTPQALAERLTRIRMLKGKSAVLVIANLVAAEEQCSINAFTINLQPTTKDKADILIVPGCVSPTNFKVTSAFKELTQIIKAKEKQNAD